MKDKKQLRELLLRQRKKYAQEKDVTVQAHSDSCAAQKALIASTLWQKSHVVAVYMAVRGEVDTCLLLEDAWYNKKTVFLPRCRPCRKKEHTIPEEQGIMDFIACNSMDDMAIGSFGIMEPMAHLLPNINMPPPEILVLPGVGFDRKGYRLGFGGGYYDRILTHPWLARTVCVGLCYTWQIVDNIPVEAWDMPVHALATTKGMLWI